MDNGVSGPSDVALMDASSDEAKFCLGLELNCTNGHRVTCALFCLDNSTYAGWYYQVKIIWNNKIALADSKLIN